MVPESFHAAYKRYSENGWMAITAEPEFGGAGLPTVVGMAVVIDPSPAFLGRVLALIVAQARTLVAVIMAAIVVAVVVARAFRLGQRHHAQTVPKHQLRTLPTGDSQEPASDHKRQRKH